MNRSLEEINLLGEGLHRPESVLACQDGYLYASDNKFGVARISPEGAVAFAGRLPNLKSAFVPNGIALCANGDFLLSNIGDDGGLWRLNVSGNIVPEVTTINGAQMPPVNFVMIDDRDRTWLSISTKQSPRHLAYNDDVADGFIGVVRNGSCHIVGEGLAYTNEIRLDATGDWLYVSETFGHRISRFKVLDNGSLGDREVFGTVEREDFVDGIAFDEAGGLWAICIVSNRIYRFDGAGRRETILSETPAAFTSDVVAALDQGHMGRAHFDTTPNSILKNVASIAFTGTQRKTAVLGGLCADRLVRFDVDVAGLKPPHWNVSPSMKFKDSQKDQEDNR